MTEGNSGENKKPSWLDRPIVLTVTGAALTGIIAIVLAIINRPEGNNQAPQPGRTTTISATSTPANVPATGKITYPARDGNNIPAPSTIIATGTIKHLEKGHHLLVFLEYGTVRKYWAGDADTIISRDGHWTDTVCLGDPSTITLLLIDTGPKGLAALERNNANYLRNSVPFLPSKLAPDVTILSRTAPLNATANGAACMSKLPNFFYHFSKN